MQKSVSFLYLPVIKQNKIHQPKEKENVLSSMFVDCFWQKRHTEKKHTEKNILRKFLSELDERKRLNFQVTVARSSCNGQASVSNHTYCTTALH